MFVVLGLGNSPDIFYKVHYIRVGGFSPYPTLLTRKENYMDKEKQETLEEKIARIEKALVDKDNEIATLKGEKETLEKKVNSLKIDGLVRKVEPTKQVEEETIQFDFDM